MDLFDGQLNFGLHLDLDIETWEKSKVLVRQKLYKLEVANKF